MLLADVDVGDEFNLM